jgi:hypothetical protein
MAARRHPLKATPALGSDGRAAAAGGAPVSAHQQEASVLLFPRGCRVELEPAPEAATLLPIRLGVVQRQAPPPRVGTERSCPVRPASKPVRHSISVPSEAAELEIGALEATLPPFTPTHGVRTETPTSPPIFQQGEAR